MDVLADDDHRPGPRSHDGQTESLDVSTLEDRTEPVVHDVGGTTAAAAWVPPTDLDRLDVTSSWRSLLRDVAWRASGGVMAPDEADGPQHHEQAADNDDRSRPQL